MTAKTRDEIEAELDKTLAKARRLAERIAKDNVSSPAAAVALLMSRMGEPEQEELWTLLLDTRNNMLDCVFVYRGSLNSTSIRIADIFREAIRKNAASIVVAHNHPSGDPSPSAEDVAMTRALVEAGKMLDVEVLDHVVLGRGQWTSLKAKQLGFE